jgi:hypothetical protein
MRRLRPRPDWACNRRSTDAFSREISSRLEIEVTQDKKTESAGRGQGRQSAWIAPVVTRLAAGTAENDLGTPADSGGLKS